MVSLQTPSHQWEGYHVQKDCRCFNRSARSSGDAACPVSQQSTLTPNEISVAMSANAFSLDSAQSTFEVDFNVATPTSFSMVGDTSWQMANGSYGIHLEGPTTLGLGDANCSYNAGGYNACTYSNDPITGTSATTTLGDGS
jgi:hypothetical protein